MLSILAFDGRGRHDIADPDRISDLVRAKGTVVWCDLHRSHDDQLTLVAREFGLQPLAIEDAIRETASQRHRQRPRVVPFETHTFVVVYAADESGELSEVYLFVGQNWLITVRGDGGEGAGAWRERMVQMAPRKVTSAFLFYVVLDEIVDGYFERVDALSGEVEAVEDRIFKPGDPERHEQGIQQEMLQVRRKLLHFRHRVTPLREVLLNLLREDLPWFGPQTRRYLQDVLDHVIRVGEELDNNREHIGNAVDAHLAIVANHQNQIMKRMTSWGAILIVATLIAGIYGMNFDHMPELHWLFGYPMALSMMAVFTLVLHQYFKRKDWL